MEEDEARPFIRRAWEAGINFFDTADIYSHGVSEEVSGRALNELGPRQTGDCDEGLQAMGDGPNERGLSRKHIRHSIDASLRRLRNRLRRPVHHSSFRWVDPDRGDHRSVARRRENG